MSFNRSKNRNFALKISLLLSGVMDEGVRSRDSLFSPSKAAFAVHNITFVKSSRGLAKKDSEFPEPCLTGMH